MFMSVSVPGQRGRGGNFRLELLGLVVIGVGLVCDVLSNEASGDPPCTLDSGDVLCN